MADGFTEFPIFIITFVAGAAVVVCLFISKLVRRVSISKVSITDAHNQTKIAESLCDLSKKSSHQSHLNKSNKKKHGDKRSRDGKQSFNHQWLLTSLKGHSSSILDMEFSPNGKYLATCGEDKRIIIWRTRDWTSGKHKNLKVNLKDDHVSLIRWSPDSKAFIVKTHLANTVEVYKVNKKTDGWLKNTVKALVYPKFHEDEIVGLGIASTGKYVVTCTKKTDLVVFDIKGVLLASVETYLMSTSCLCLSPCGRYISACGFAPEAKTWEVQFSKTGDFKQVVRVFDLKGHSSGILQTVFNNDSSRMGTVSKDGSWKVFNINVELNKGEDPKLVTTGKYPYEEKVSRLALSPHGDVVAVSSGADLYLYFADTGELDTKIKNIFQGSITRILFDSEGKYILISGTKHVRILHNVTGFKATAKTAREKLCKSKNTSAMRERLQQQIADSEALISKFCC